MKLKAWLKEGRGRTVALAKHLQVTKSMVSQMADETSSTPIPPAMYRRIRAFTEGQVDFEDMIPSDPMGEVDAAQLAATSSAKGLQLAPATPACWDGVERREKDEPIAFGNRREGGSAVSCGPAGTP